MHPGRTPADPVRGRRRRVGAGGLPDDRVPSSRYLARHRLDVFAYYRLVIAAVTFALLSEMRPAGRGAGRRLETQPVIPGRARFGIGRPRIQALATAGGRIRFRILGFPHVPVDPPQLHRRILRHRAAVHQRRGVHLDLQRRRRADRRRSTIGCSDGAFRGSASLSTAVGVLLVGAFATNVIGKRLLQRARATCCGCRCFGRSTRRSSSWSSRSRRTTSTGSSGW